MRSLTRLWGTRRAGQSGPREPIADRVAVPAGDWRKEPTFQPVTASALRPIPQRPAGASANIPLSSKSLTRRLGEIAAVQSPRPTSRQGHAPELGPPPGRPQNGDAGQRRSQGRPAPTLRANHPTQAQMGERSRPAGPAMTGAIETSQTKLPRILRGRATGAKPVTLAGDDGRSPNSAAPMPGDQRNDFRSRRRPKKPVSRWRQRAASLGLALTFVSVMAIVLGGGLPFGVRSISDAVDKLGIAAGADISHIAVTGYNRTALDEIYDAIDLDERATFAAFDAEAARGRLAKLPWVKHTRVIFILPDTLAVEIEEREPKLVWQNSNLLFLIDGEGHVLEPVSPKAFPSLPLIVGEGAPEAAGELFAALEDHPKLASTVKAYRRIGKRRWTLDLDSGLSVHLPSDGIVPALKQAAQIAETPDVSRKYATLDLRVPGEIVLRRRTRLGGAAQRRARLADPAARSTGAGQVRATARPVTRLHTALASKSSKRAQMGQY